MTRFGCHDHINPALMDGVMYDAELHERWLFDGPDARLADFARYRLPDSLLAKMARAYFQHAANDKAEILADSREDFEDDLKTGADA
ncbi:hypothetical protein LF41_2385 [Lysobacter dokdonensis DS-58]|uniref:Uncharacterized protein n=1 Tax=Lysobacter dokdonensis DS-58 TaxID=1300345 RepID=A0A0A2WJ79_9GAMM|nr:hypothetical protein [Lysobacter dokdonensis]KGQ19878.1 hypothetical protein LF41_2385 [Lysobacter dokdonensis DS-58]